MNKFFQGFNFDTMLALISCVTGIVAFFLGSKAYYGYKKIKKSFNDKKKFGDGGIDNSQKAAGDIVNNNCDAYAVATITSANFSVALNEAYKRFEKQAEHNLKCVIEETGKIIRENKLNLSDYTKIDWINIYFESAKNAADTYMQNVWAKVLAKELEIPGTFSYKTLDVLKNMSKEDFCLFEQMCTVQINGTLIQGEAYKKYGLDWLKCLKLSELGLLSLDSSERSFELGARTFAPIMISESYVLTMNNTSDEKVKVRYPVYILTYAAKELMNVASYKYSEKILLDIVEDLKKRNSTAITYEIQNVIRVDTE